jgi:deoxyadenosine/deoxycytidine kinase
MNKWYIIEGNIGSGKSTLLKMLNGLPNTEVIQEPVNIWTSIKDDEGTNLLQHFYSDMNRNSYMFQTMVFKTRLESLEAKQLQPLRFSERSIWTDRYVFGKMCIEDNKMNSIESKCYNHWFNWLGEKFKPTPDGIIYIRCTPEKCLERINKRSRDEENTISLDYIKKLHTYHEDWLQNWKETPILIIDNEKDDDYTNIINKVINSKLININDNINNKIVNNYSYFE